MTPSLNSSHIIDSNGSQIGNNTTLTHENQNMKTVNDFNISNVTTKVTPSKFLYSKYNKSTTINTNHLSSTPSPTPENNASPITLSCMDDAKTGNTNNNNANKDLYQKNYTVIKFCKQGLLHDNLLTHP